MINDSHILMRNDLQLPLHQILHQITKNCFPMIRVGECCKTITTTLCIISKECLGWFQTVIGYNLLDANDIRVRNIFLSYMLIEKIFVRFWCVLVGKLHGDSLFSLYNITIIGFACVFWIAK